MYRRLLQGDMILRLLVGFKKIGVKRNTEHITTRDKETMQTRICLIEMVTRILAACFQARNGEKMYAVGCLEGTVRCDFKCLI